MYESMTYEQLLEDVLERISEKYDKRQGSIIYDCIAPLCVELAKFYLQLDNVLNEGFADTATREYLIKRAKERGLAPYDATSSVILADLQGDFSLSGGERFNLEQLNFFYTGEKEEDYYKLQCEEEGEIGNISYGELLPIDTIEGLSTANVIKIFTYGKDEEETEDFRERYFESFEIQAFGGNRADYMQKIKQLNELTEILQNGGIGGCKLYRSSKAIGDVSIYITNTSFTAPTEKLIDCVQNEIDPKDSSGDGYGIAPIGHIVTIFPVEEVLVNIDVTLDLKTGYSLEDVKEYVEEKIEDYIKTVAKTWEDEEYLIIRISHVESCLLEILGIIDIKETKINDKTENLILGENDVPIRGIINVS